MLVFWKAFHVMLIRHLFTTLNTLPYQLSNEEMALAVLR